MSTQRDYSGFFVDLPTEEAAFSVKPSKNDSCAGFFADLDEAESQPSLTPNNAAAGKYEGFFSDLDQPQQQIPQFGQPGQEILPEQAPLEIAQEQPRQPGFLQKAGDYFRSGKLGEAATMQMKSGGFAQAPALEPKAAKKVATEVGTIAAVEAAFAPVIGLVAAAKFAPRLLTSLTRLTQAGTTGAAVATTGKLVEEGELPSQEELLENGATWVAIDAAMQALHLTAGAGKKAYDFGKAVNNIAEKEGVKPSDVLQRLWNSTKNYLRQRGRVIQSPEDITPEDAQVLIDQTKQAEERLKPAGKEAVSPEKASSEQLPEREFAGEDQNLFDQIRFIAEGEPSLEQAQAQWAVDKMKEAGNDTGKLQSILNKMPVMWAEREGRFVPQDIEEPSEAEAETFTTEKGSTYAVHPNGSTTRTKAARPEHPGEEGVQPQSEKTYYLTPEQAKKLSEINARGPSRRIAELGDGSIGIQYDKGEHKGRFEKRTVVKPKTSPEAGLIPLETWSDGRFHFGNKIAQVGGAPKAEKPLPSTASKKFQTRPAEAKLQPRAPVAGKKQAVARSKVINLFRKAFTDPIRIGKFRSKMKGGEKLGFHRLWAKVSRLLKANDVETAAHEIGHNLHTTLYEGDAKTPTQQRENVNAALRPYLNELKPLALYEPFGMEGFAEFTRLYVTNPDVALELAPKFYAKFEADLEAQYPEMKNALLEARDYYDQYLQGTPESRIRAQTSYASDQGKLENIVDWIKEMGNLDKLKTNFLDDVFPAKRLVAEAFGIPLTEVENLKDPRNLYRSLRVLKGAIGKADVFLLHETFDANSLKRRGRGLRSILKKLPNEEAYKEFNDYLIARRSIEKAEQGVETGINRGDALYVEEKLRPKYGKLALLLDQYNDALLRYALDGGLLSPQQYRDIKEKNLLYVPFQRVMEKPSGGATATAGKLQAGKPLKRMRGSTRDIVAPLESIVKNTYSIIINAEKNLSGQVLAELSRMKNIGRYIERVPTPTELKAKIHREEIEKSVIKHLKETGQGDFLEMEQDGDTFKFVLREDVANILPDLIMKFGATTYPAGENIVTVYRAGKPEYYEVSPEIFEMWTKGISPYTSDLITKILRVPARTLRAGAILNPKFMMKNVVRDTWGGFLFTKYGKTVKDPTGLFIDTLYSPLANLVVAAKQGKLYVQWLKAGGGMGTMQSLDRQAIEKRMSEIRHGLKPTQVIQWLRKVAEISEEANRLAEFGRALKAEEDTRLGKEIAAFAARDLSIDFAKMGLQTKALNQIIPFFNATIQGGDKLIRTLASDKDRAEFIARAIGFILIPSLILAFLNKDDERVKEFQDQERDFNFITFVGDTAIKIPVPFETGVIVHGLTQRMFDYFMNKNPNAFEGLFGSIRSAMMPNMIPSLANPLIETMANRNFFTGARIVPAAKENLIAKYQYKNNTSLTARLIGRAMAYMLGQDTRSKSASPAIIDHFIHSWTAGLGRLIVSLADSSLEAAGLGDKIPKPETTITEKLGIDAFTTRYPRSNTRSIEKFYDMYGDATARHRSIKHAEKIELEEPEEIEKAYKRVEKLYDYPTLKRAYKAMQQNQRAINEIWLDPSMDEKTKREMIDDLYLQQIQFAKEAVQDIERYRLAG